MGFQWQLDIKGTNSWGPHRLTVECPGGPACWEGGGWDPGITEPAAMKLRSRLSFFPTKLSLCFWLDRRIRTEETDGGAEAKARDDSPGATLAIF